MTLWNGFFVLLHDHDCYQSVAKSAHVIILLSYVEVQLVYKIPQEIYMSIFLVTSFTLAASSPGKQFMSPAISCFGFHIQWHFGARNLGDN